jgi:hypothetical protein
MENREAVQPIPMNLPAVVPPLPGAMAPPSTFAELFQSMPDVYNGEYQAYLNTYGPNDTLPGTLLQRTTLGFPHDTVPPVFIYLTQQGQIRSVHNLHHIIAPPGQPLVEWENVCLGLGSDIHEGHITALVLPAQEIFSLTPEIDVPTLETMAAQLVAGENGMVPPIAVGALDIEQVRSRKMIPVPYAYVRLFLFRILSPAEAWNQVGVQIIADGRTEDCEVLLNFLRAATVPTFGQIRQDPNRPPLIALQGAVHPPIGDATFYSHLTRKLRALLPGGTMAPTPNAILQQVMHGQNMLRQTIEEAAMESQTTRRNEIEASQLPKSFSDIFPAHAAKVRKLCGAGNDDDRLPEFWRYLARANGKKAAGFSLLQELATTRANDADSARVLPIVSAALYEQVSKFRIGTGDTEDLKVGLSPFLMCPVGYHRADAQRQLNEQYQIIHEGAHPTLADTMHLLPATYNLPTDIHQLVDFIGAFSVIIDVLLGVENPVAISLRSHHRFWDLQKSMVANSLPRDAHHLVILGTLRYLQLNILRFFNQQMYSGLQIPPPIFSYLETMVLDRTFQVLPPMPAEYYHSQQTTTTPPNAMAGGGAAFKNADTKGSSEQSRGTQVTAPTTQVVTTWHERFEGNAKSIQTLKNDGGKKLPKTANGACQICLSYHLKGSCFTNCRNKLSHRKLDTAETTTFQTFVDAHL